MDIVVLVVIYLLVFFLDFLPKLRQRESRANVFYGIFAAMSFCGLLCAAAVTKHPLLSELIRSVFGTL